MRHEQHGRKHPGRLLLLGAALLALCAAIAAAMREPPREPGERLTGATGRPFAVTRAPETDNTRLILDCTVPDLRDEAALRLLAATIYNSHQGTDFEQVFIRYRLAPQEKERRRRDKSELKAIAVLSKNSETFGLTR